MPTPDGREWLSSKAIADNLMERIKDDVPQGRIAALKMLLEDGFSGMYGIEFKILRLTEKLKDAIEAGNFGPLFVDAEGNPVRPQDYDPARGHQHTQAYDIWRAFRDIYTMDVLENVDEDGNLL